jgi:transposase-like protein
MVSAFRRCKALRKVARQFGVAPGTVHYWVQRAVGRRLDRVDWEDGSRAPRRTRRTSTDLERKILAIRQRLKLRSALGEHGAVAIHRELQAKELPSCPSVRTIGRILQRHGVLDGRKRIRRPPPLRGWYLPEVAAGKAELDSFDTIEGLAIRGGPHLTVLTGISLHGGLPVVWPMHSVSSRSIVELLVEHWRRVGLPGFAQFDNDNRFCGPKQYADVVGRVSRLCLSLNVTPVFAPPYETGFQAAIESLNGRWQKGVWSRFEHRNLRGLKHRSEAYVTAARQKLAARIDAAPPRRPFPKRWQLNLQQHPRGTVVYIRRTNDHGQVSLLGHPFPVDSHWLHRLVRAEVHLNAKTINIYALRRREPTEQPMLNTIPYVLPQKTFKE